MTKAIIGKKLGMTQIFSEKGDMIPVTVVEAGPCLISQIKTKDGEGYDAVQVAFCDVKETRISKAEAGHLKKSNIAPKKYLKEFRFDDCSQYAVGGEIKCDSFIAGDIVDVSGLTRGRGFTGVIQRWNTHRLKMTHGTGPVHRSVGSMGANSSPSRVFKGKKMAGQYGNEKVTIQNLEVVRVDKERNVLLIKGSVPGPRGGLLTVRNAVKGKK
ncbi:MAG: 50S ribosomal protein L3 [Firmicutes bacterium]|nr:50S ribosomal protein L3 [Bacillota bacterium]